MKPNPGDPTPRAIDSQEWHDLEVGASATNATRIDATGEIIGPYQVLRSLGHGGMGEVFLAERADQQFEQRVAIKLVKRGLLSKQVQSRLRVERQILASLEHPNIARLLDGGSTPDGTPYIVMEYVDGKPIDEYCDTRRLGIKERLDLFRNVCAAVHSAHQNLIVHRDLKPSNILVTEAGVPKLLDFGIAKILDTRLLNQTVALTEFDVRMLTPDHASPEQLRGDLITTASDTYVLGVLLYELLTGCKPFSIKSQSFGELERAICEEPPLPPSQVFSAGSAATQKSLEEIAALRSSTVTKLRRELQGDLGSIILMALRKEPERRYASVQQFAADLDHYLQGLPVNARPDAWAYRTGKFIKRHAVVVALGTVLAMTLIASTIIASAQRLRADRERQTAQVISSFLIDLFKTADPSYARGETLTALEILDTGAKQIRTRLAGQKGVQALMLNTIGQVYLGLGAYEQAQPLLEDAWDIFRNELQIETTDVADVALNLGELYIWKDELEKAEHFMNLSAAIGTRTQGPQGISVIRAQCGFALIYMHREKYISAEQQFRKCIAMYDALGNAGASEATTPVGWLAQILALRGEYEGAETLHRRLLAATQDLPPGTPSLLENQQNLATVLQAKGELQEALTLYRTVITATRRVWPGSERLEIALINQGTALQELTQFEASDQSFNEALSINEKLRLPEDERGYLMGRMASLALDRGDTGGAERLYRGALAKLQDKPRYRSSVLVGLSKTLLKNNQAKEAQLYIEQALPLLEKVPGKSGYLYGLAQATLGRALWVQGAREPAASLLDEGYRKYVAQRGDQVPEARLMRAWLDDLGTGAPDPRPVGGR